MVLILGETGTGKEVISNAIHRQSLRKNEPFIKVNCGAIQKNLIDSELFGHEKGAFTGAVKQKRGRFERTHKGTILLDEIGELPPWAQIRLLRVLQTQEIERLDGSPPISSISGSSPQPTATCGKWWTMAGSEKIYGFMVSNQRVSAFDPFPSRPSLRHSPAHQSFYGQAIEGNGDLTHPAARPGSHARSSPAAVAGQCQQTGKRS